MAEALQRRAVVCLVDLDEAGLTALVDDQQPDIVPNCVGVLQDGPRSTTGEAHEAFMGRLLAAVAVQNRPILPIHLGVASHDATPFGRRWQAGERQWA